MTWPGAYYRGVSRLATRQSFAEQSLLRRDGGNKYAERPRRHFVTAPTHHTFAVQP